MAYNVSADLWYQYFMADGPQIWILIGAFGARSLWALIGIIFNVGLIWITVKSKSLHGTCSILLALESFFATTMNATFLISFLVVISGYRFIRYELCLPILMLPGMMLGNCAQLAMVFTGLDRVIAVIFPVWYNLRNRIPYMVFTSLALLCYSAFIFNVYYSAYSSNLDMMLSCSTNEVVSGSMATLMSTIGYSLSATLMAMYTLIWLCTFKISTLSERVNQRNRRLARSLLFIIGFNLIGVFVKCSFLFLLQFVPVSVFFLKGQSLAFSFLTIAVYSSNAPVLYMTSTEYRTQFNKQFSILPKVFKCGLGNGAAPIAQDVKIPTSWIGMQTMSVVQAQRGQQIGPRIRNSKKLDLHSH